MRQWNAHPARATTRGGQATKFSQVTSPGRFLLVAEALKAEVENLGWLNKPGLQSLFACPSGGMGRSDTAIVPLPGSGIRLHLRPFRHGGWLAGLRGHRLLRLNRLTSELHATAVLAAAGAPVPAPALVVGYQQGRLWEAALATVFEEETIDARVWLAEPPTKARLLAAAAAAGRSIRRFHDAGGCHRDLHLGNILVRERLGHTEIVIVDLDGVKTRPHVSPARRMRELMRLHRSLIKRGLTTTLGPEGYSEFFNAYTQDDPHLRRALLRHHNRERLRVALHATGYRTQRRSI